MTAKELAMGVAYTESIDSGWRHRLCIRKMHPNHVKSLRERLGIEVEGQDVPPPVDSFGKLRLPKAIVKKLRDNKINKLFKIQNQGLPVGLSGRDMIGISYTGSGKTIAFIIPMIMNAC